MKKRIWLVWIVMMLAALSCNALRPGRVRLVTLTPDATQEAEAGAPAGALAQTSERASRAKNTPVGKTPLAPTETPAGDETARERATPTIERKRQPTWTPQPSPEQASPTPPVLATNTLEVQAPELVGAVGEQSIGDDYYLELGNTGYDVLNYTLQMALDPAEAEIPAARVIAAAASTLENLAQFSLDFIGFEIDELLVNGEPAYYERQGGKLVISLAQPLRQSETFILEIAYHGEPVFEQSPFVPFDDHVGMFFVTRLDRLYVVSEPDGARYWFPCNDHPRDKATYRFEITVPENQVGIANGLLVDTFTELPNAFPDGRAGDRYTWEEDNPMATYLATVVVGDYVRVEGTSPAGVPLASYVFPDQQVQMEALMPLVGEAMDWMSEQFGPYPFDTFGYVTVNGLGGALETQSIVVMGSLNEEVMIHELAHMWFGDWVSLDSWGDMWRNEGFATYISAMWFARENPDELEGRLRSWSLLFEGRSLYPLNDPRPASLFGAESYQGGALLVHDLRREMGDEAFFAGLRSYLSRYGGGAASTEQFQDEMELAAGKDLDDFFARWVSD